MVFPLLPLLPSVIGAVGGLLGNKMESDATASANAQSIEQARLARVANRHAATKAFQRDRSTMNKSDRMNDRNVKQAQRFQAKQAKLAWNRTDESALRNREWAVADYAQARADQASQYTDLRDAAAAGGFNPLSVLGTGVSASPAGGLTSSSYAAASGVGVQPVAGFGASVPMSYGAPIAVAPLSSNASIIGAVQEFGREMTGIPAQERANAQLYSDIAKIEMERAQAGMVAPQVPSMGRQAVPVEASTGLAFGEGFNRVDERPGDPFKVDPATGRVTDLAAVINDPGYTEVSTPFGTFKVPTVQGEMIGVEDYPMLAAGAAFGVMDYGRKSAIQWAADQKDAWAGWSNSLTPPDYIERPFNTRNYPGLN